jgi:hypothetical protein
LTPFARPLSTTLKAALRVDYGPEFLSEALVQWAKAHRMAIQ